MNGRFAISMHILTLLERFKGEVLSSEFIAGSININPVLVRKEIANLKKHSLVESKEGKAGGFTLAKPASKIMVADIYKAVGQNSVLGKSVNDPNPDCKIGKQINEQLNALYEDAESAVLKKLGNISLSDFHKNFS
ncbi:Rrf2 family transcriptional regulator [Sporocytophaga myxococcoides]|uniref:Rrf2 family transcriptional regulator n=1 Tax=Sporocytophaga myxococcoides TaxID=153721 RepID=UPI00040A21A2|nr:Rrf2 family transcriptional regulator [Sporocytophaga myxococcoides]